jgi:hypothetical protein
MAAPVPGDNTERASASLLCRACGKPLAGETAHGDGNAVHRGCYININMEPPTAHQVPTGSDDPASTHRPWQVVAEQASREQDPTKLNELVTELTQALDEQVIGKPARVRSDGEVKPDENSPAASEDH